MKTFKIKKGDYYDTEKNDVLVEVKNNGKEYTVEVAKIKNTIQFLKRKREDFLKQVESEIEENQEILDSIDTDLKKVKVKEFKRPKSDTLEVEAKPQEERFSGLHEELSKK